MRYTKRPVTIDVWPIEMLLSMWEQNMVMPFSFSSTDLVFNENSILVHTIDGDMTGNESDYLIRGIKGELYPCKREIFNETYDVVPQ